MNYKMVVYCIIYLSLFNSCSKEKGSLHRAEGYVYENITAKPVSNIPIYMYECNHTGTRCVYTFISEAYTDANGFYKISGRSKENGSLYIEVGNNEKTFPSTEIYVHPTQRLVHNFTVDKAVYVTTRFIVQPLNRSFMQVSIRSGIYSAASAIFRNSNSIVDTTLKFKTSLNSEVRMETFAANQVCGNIPFCDSVFFNRFIGIVTKDTSTIWRVP